MKEAKKYYWLKLKDDFFSQPRIKKLRRIAGGDTYTIIYLKLQLLSLKNDGVLVFEGIEEDFAEELSLTIDEDVDNVRFTLMYLRNQGLIEEINQDEYALVETIKSIGSETSSAERVRKHREKKKALQCNTLVTSCNTEIEIEKEIDKDIEIDYIYTQFNETCVSLPQVKKLTDARKKTIRARLKEYSAEDIVRVFELAEDSDFLAGRKGDWSADFDWLMKPNNFIKVLEGNYANKEMSMGYGGVSNSLSGVPKGDKPLPPPDDEEEYVMTEEERLEIGKLMLSMGIENKNFM